MTYPQQQISHIINFLVDNLRFKDKHDGYVTLTGGQKKTKRREFSVYLDNEVHRNPAQIIIAPPSDKYKRENKFIEFFSMLEEEGYLFPEDTCFILEPNKTYLKQNGMKTQIYDRQKRKHQTKMERVSELSDLLAQMSLQNTYDSHSDGSIQELSNADDDSYDEMLSTSPSTFTPSFNSPAALSSSPSRDNLNQSTQLKPSLCL